MAGLIAALMVLAACEEKEVILPGQRQDVRTVVGGGGAPAPEMGAVEAANKALPISLPGQVTNASWAQSFGMPVNRVANAALGAAPQQIWQANIGKADTRRQRITATPVVGGGMIYTLDAGARVTATSLSGQTVWSRDVIPAGESEGSATGGGLALSDGTLYVSSGYGNLTALDAVSGQPRWQKKLGGTGNGTPMVSDGLVYLVSGDDTGWAVETKTGRIAWQFAGAPSVANVLGGPAPVIAGRYAIFAFGSGDLVAVFRQGGLRRWSASVSGQRLGRAVSRISDVTGSPVVDGNKVYAGNHSGRLVAFDATSGSRLWTAQEGALGPVWPVGGSLFLVTDRHQLIRVNASDGAPIWATELPGYVKDRPRRRGKIYANYGPILAGGRIVTSSSDGQIRFVDPVSGAITRTVEIPGGAATAPVVAGQTMYVVSRKGVLHAYR
ncbi:PQQ-like beta-propeller repeat protein [Chachezhania sediminis]|uniref:PQQ-like beta-propeller repeat protein n=1 Tax=Chachezhania sediminis TaxID=2599291 RepID=UPI001E5D7F9A|nr:PQQ-like beta-propeller repeat protein [Chachezhania sediminis]